MFIDFFFTFIYAKLVVFSQLHFALHLKLVYYVTEAIVFHLHFKLWLKVEGITV